MSDDHAGNPEEQPDHDATATAGIDPGRSSNSGPGGADSVSSARDGSHHAEIYSARHADFSHDQNSAVVPAELVEAVEEEAERVAIRTLQAASFSGPLPMAADLHEYSETERERILRIAEAFSSDESKRRDTMVQSATTVAQRAQWLTPVMLFGAFIFAFASYFAFENVVLSGLFLSVPVLRVIGSSIATVVRRRRDPDDGDED